MRPITRIIVHHSVSPSDTTLSEIRSWHLQRGYRDIGYHYAFRLDEDGTPIMEVGRPIELPGAHCPGYNGTSIGVCVCGNYSLTEPLIEGALWSFVINRLQALMHEYKISPDRVIGHREAPGAATECPGLLLDLNMFRKCLEINHGGGGNPL